MKLSDPTHGLKDTELERLTLQGQGLDDFRRFWDQSAVIDAPGAIADDMADDESFERSGRADAESLVPFLPPDAVVLDIGCGVGRVMKYLPPMCREVHGIDISMKMIQAGRDRLGHIPGVQFHLGNGYDLGEFCDDKFDLVYSVVTFQHIPKTIAYNYLIESYRVLRMDGTLQLHVPNLLRDDDFAAFNHLAQPFYVNNPYPMNFYTPVELARLLVAAGFWVDRLTDRITVGARKTGAPGLSDQAKEQIGTLDPEKQQLIRRVSELEQALDRIRSNSVIRAGILIRNQFRRWTRPFP
jgi:ubiquinone/menaquinone biosynthesis C-methylase UbiE